MTARVQLIGPSTANQPQTQRPLTMQIPRYWIGLFVASLLGCMTGCSTLSSLGFPSGSHKLLRQSDEFRESAGYALPWPRELAKQPMSEYRVEPGDVLVVEPNDFNSNIRLPSDQPVQPDGNIDLGRYGRLYVEGMSVEAIEDEVQSLVSMAEIERRAERAMNGNASAASDEEIDDSISVRLVNKESKVFYVVGEVNAPGAYPLTGRETILDALMVAGGLTDRASKHKLIYTRPTQPDDCRVVLPICYQRIVQLGDTSTNYQIRPGDRIFVPSTTLVDDVKSFLCLSDGESCPKCAGLQTACYSAACSPSKPCRNSNCRACGSR